jgi:hypothetical protein
MAARPLPDPQGGWMVRLGNGPAACARGGFASAAAASGWAAMVTEAARRSAIRIGPRRIPGTLAEALRRWAIDQGTLPEAEGGTHLAPLRRFEPLLSDPACAWPLAALRPDDLVALRARRRAALGEAAMLVEQAALVAAVDALRDLYLSHLENPFCAVADDGVFLTPEGDPPAARRLAAYVAALRQGCHLDEVLILAGLHAGATPRGTDAKIHA